MVILKVSFGFATITRHCADIMTAWKYINEYKAERKIISYSITEEKVDETLQ